MAGRVAFCITMLYVAGTDRRVNKWAKYTTWVFIVGQVLINMLAFVSNASRIVSRARAVDQC